MQVLPSIIAFMKPNLAEQPEVHRMSSRNRYTLMNGQACRNETDAI